MKETKRHLFTLAGLPLPDGWDAYQYADRWLIVHCPKVGAVTIDAEHRVIRPGYTATFGKPVSAAKYAGRGWTNQLHADAVAWLRDVESKRRP